MSDDFARALVPQKGGSYISQSLWRAHTSLSELTYELTGLGDSSR